MANQIDLSRKPRSTETRETEARQVSWKPAHDLPVPNPIDGYGFRWIRVSMMGNPDPANMARSRREGWVPCKASDHPEISSDFAAFGLAPSSDLIEIDKDHFNKGLHAVKVKLSEITNGQAVFS